MTKIKNLLGRSALSSGLVLGIALAAGPAFAQDAPAPEVAGGEVSDADVIVVTGSRIARTDLSSTTPIAVVSSESIRQEGAANIQDILNELPQVGIGSSRTNTNFLTSGNGVATINLRNLGASRTLVLVNGRRFVAGLAGSSAVDINNIPTDFIDRVEVVTGGQSAIYGSEAIAGVVNFILKDEFEGLSARGQYGITSRGDNARYLASITGGTAFGPDQRGHVLVNFSYDKDEGLFSNKRGISDQDCFLAASPDECGPASYSSYAAQGRFQLLDADGAGSDLFTFNRNNELVNGFPVGSGFNRNGVRRISVPLERYLATGIVNYQLTDNIKAYAEVTYAKVKSSSQIEATPLDYADIYADGQGIPITNPFIPNEIKALIAARNSNIDPDTGLLDTSDDVTSIGFRRRQNEVFSRSNTNDRETWRVATGLTGDITEGWTFDVGYVYGRLKDVTLSQDIDGARYRNALDSVLEGGQIVCRSAAARADGCVPINIFGFNTASPEASAYVLSAIPKSERIKNEEHVVSASVSGSLFHLPAGDVAVAVGGEYRRESSVDDLDELTNTGGNSGNMIPDTRGKFDVWEAFAEINVPLIAEKPFFNYLGLNGAARYSDYSTVGGVFSWNAGAEWSPVEGLRFRGSYAEANRAPNIGELFSAPSETFPTGITDPCEGVGTTANGGASATVAAACRALPGFARNVATSPDGTFFYDLADIQGINGFDGGNINLQEETAKTLTLGVVIAPAQVPGLSLTVDYFDIKVENAIDTVPRQVSIEGCLDTGDAAFCDNVIRDANTGRLLTINSQLINVADFRTSGVDANLRYARPLGLSADDRIDLNIAYTYLIKLEKRSFPGAPLEENRGQLDGDGRLGAGFKHKASGRAAYTTGPYTFSWQVNYLGKIQDTIGGYGDDALDALNSVGDKFYHDVQFRVAVGERRQFEFYIGADNLFDTNAPFLPSGFASDITGTETAADTYDPFGRRLYAGFQVKL